MASAQPLWTALSQHFLRGPIHVPATAAKPSQLQPIDGYLWIPTAALRVPGFARVELFTCGLGELAPRPLRVNPEGVSEEQINIIERDGPPRVLIRRSDLSVVSDSILTQLDRIVGNVQLSVADRFGLLQIAQWHRLEHNLRKICCDRFVEAAQLAGRRIARLLTEVAAPAGSTLLACDLYEASLRDDSSAVHLTNVSAYVILLAQQMGVAQPEELEKIAVGAMLHEFGKLFLPRELLNKTGRLSVQERELVERAPQLGYENLCERPDLEFGQLMMVYQQHERFDGSGYPVGIEGDEIHLWARILAVADTFDTMIVKKAYRRESRVAEALLYLSDNADLHFDPKVVLCWSNIFPQR